MNPETTLAIGAGLLALGAVGLWFVFKREKPQRHTSVPVVDSPEAQAITNPATQLTDSPALGPKDQP